MTADYNETRSGVTNSNVIDISLIKNGSVVKSQEVSFDEFLNYFELF